MTEPIVKFTCDRAELGYCNLCTEATAVGTLEVKGWRHAVKLCAGCIAAMANRITAASHAALKEAK